MEKWSLSSPISGSKHDTAQMVTHPRGWDYTVLSAKNEWLTAFSVGGAKQIPEGPAPRMLWDLAEAITSCYVQVVFWLDPVALTTKEDRSRSEHNQQANVFVANFPPWCRVLGLMNSISPSTGAGDDPWRSCQVTEHLQS